VTVAPGAPSPPRPRLAVAVGDPRGIGPEVVRKALRQPIAADVRIVGAWEDGAPNELEAGRAAAQGIEAAARLALAGEVDAIVTGPVHKGALHVAGYRFPGVTEFLAHVAGDVPVAMMLATGRLRVVLVTTHYALRDAITMVTTERVVQAGRIAGDALRQWWGIAAPRLAVCGINPHAGEGGLFGDEDERVLQPAAAALAAAGPLPADTVFVRALRGEFDAVLAPYHDVGMTAVKVSGFGAGVNVTLGLPFIRTSPDHGTAFDIAGKGVADAGSMRAALELAVQLAGARREARV
jgi:4-hydroxythreonine-4-phosphate dehydrogenase